MKTIYSLIIFLFFIHSSIKGQSCLPDGITFTSQAQIDSFPYNYPSCSEIEGFVTIGPLNSWDEIDIANLDSLISLTSILGDLKVWNNDILPDLKGLDSLVSIGGDLLIETNSSVENLEGLEALSTVGGKLRIYGGNYITSLDGLENLQSVGGEVDISYNNALNDISQLSSLNQINGALYIFSNASLSSIFGLHAIDPLSISSLTISNNASLSLCSIGSVCYFIYDQLGDYTISSNNTGCNSDIQILQSCLVISVKEEIDKNSIQVYPNPANNTLYLSGDDLENFEDIIIYNQTGQKQFLELNQAHVIDVSMLSSGVYIIEIHSDRKVIRNKIIIE